MHKILYMLTNIIKWWKLQIDLLILSMKSREDGETNPAEVVFSSDKDLQRVYITLNAGSSTKVTYSEGPLVQPDSVGLQLTDIEPIPPGLPIQFPVAQEYGRFAIFRVSPIEEFAVARTKEVILTFLMRYVLRTDDCVRYRYVQLYVTCPDVQLAI